jgi:hypothetical protein
VPTSPPGGPSSTYLDEIDRRFAGWPRLRVLQLEQDVSDAPSLAAIEQQLGPLLDR